MSIGTGFIYDKDQLVLTAYHCNEDEKVFKIKKGDNIDDVIFVLGLNTNTKTTLSKFFGTLQNGNKKEDWAIIKLKNFDLKEECTSFFQPRLMKLLES